MHGDTAVLVDALEVGDVGAVQLAESAHDSREAPGLLFPGGIAGGCLPPAGPLVPAQPVQPGGELDILNDSRALGDVADVVENVSSLRELVGPVASLRERVRIPESRGVEPDTRVGVLGPRPTQHWSVFDDDEGHPSLLIPVCRSDTGDTCPDDEHGELATISYVIEMPLRRSAFVRGEVKLMFQRTVPMLTPSGEETQEISDGLIREQINCCDPVVPELAQPGQRHCLGAFLLIGRHAPVRMGLGVHRAQRRLKVVAQ